MTSQGSETQADKASGAAWAGVWSHKLPHKADEQLSRPYSRMMERSDRGSGVMPHKGAIQEGTSKIERKTI